MKRTAALFCVATALLAAVTLAACGPSASIDSTAPLTDAEADGLYQQDIDDMLRRLVTAYPEAAVPAHDRVRWLTPEEWAETIAECMTSSGFIASALADGGIQFGDIPEEQAEAQNVAYFVCQAKYPIHPEFQRGLSEGQLEALFHYFTSEVQPCLETHGVEVPPPPSVEVFIDSYAETGGWNPYQNAVGMNEEEWADLIAACPQRPHGSR